MEYDSGMSRQRVVIVANRPMIVHFPPAGLNAAPLIETDKYVRDNPRFPINGEIVADRHWTPELDSIFG